jgi:hypothetical protein
MASLTGKAQCCPRCRFLDLNNVEFKVVRGELYDLELFDLTMAVAQGQAHKPQIGEFFRQRAH